MEDTILRSLLHRALCPQTPPAEAAPTADGTTAEPTVKQPAEEAKPRPSAASEPTGLEEGHQKSAQSSHSSKGQLEAFEEAVAKMIRGVSPDPGEAQTCSYYAKVLNALQWFCEAQSGPKGQMKKLLRGEAALNYLFKQMAAKMPCSAKEAYA